MYFCLNCNEHFERADSYMERHGLDNPPYENILCCPYCNDTDIVETIPCDICGEPISENYIYIKSEGRNVCDNCYQEKEI